MASRPRPRLAKVLTVKTYAGDAKTLLAFNLPNVASTKNLAGFTVQCQPPEGAGFYLQNDLQFPVPALHVQDTTLPATSSLNAPFQKFRWLHVPGTTQGTKPPFGPYSYTITPRYFDGAQSLLAIDPTQSVTVSANVQPFQKLGVALGFTRGFIQSQAFVHHFGVKAILRPSPRTLQFDTSAVAGTNSAGQKYTFADEYAWAGWTARTLIFDVLNQVVADPSLHLDVFAYDLDEPDVIAALLTLAKGGRVRIILDDASLHHNATSPKPEDEFATLFNKAAKGNAGIVRGHFQRFSHDKVFIVSGSKGPIKVLTGSTNFSIDGLYVNANHAIVFNDPDVAAEYQQVFDAAWNAGTKGLAFLKSPLSSTTFEAGSKLTPPTEITFSPHTPAFATSRLGGIVSRIEQEETSAKGSVLFAVMDLDASGALLQALRTLHANQTIFSFGISDTTSGIQLYEPGKKTGVLVTGKPAKTVLPPPFDQVDSIGFAHQVHHKFVVCGFNGANPVVYCGSSNLDLDGEESNGDNLIAIHDQDVATAFAIEALALVDHFLFLDRCATSAGSTAPAPAARRKGPKYASKAQLATTAEWFLATTDQWAAPYFDPDDLHFVDRQLFG